MSPVGFVLSCHDCMVQISRSFGDAQFKRSGASVVPDIQAFTITDRDSFMLVACDGFWGVSVLGSILHGSYGQVYVCHV